MPAGRPPNPIKKLVSEIQEMEQRLEDSLSHNDPRTLPGVQVRQREWSNKLQQLKLDYKAALKERGFAMFLVGSPEYQKQFAQIASDFDCYAMNADIMYEMLSKRIWASIRPQDSFSVDHVQMIDEQLYDLRTQLGISSMPHPSITSDMVRPIHNLENLVLLVKMSIERVLDSELASLYIEDIATTQAIADGYTGTVLPLVLVGADQKQIQDFQRRIFRAADGSNKTFVIAVGPEATSALAECTVNKIDQVSVVNALVQAAQKFGFKISKPKAAATVAVEADKQSTTETQSNSDNSTTTEEK